MSEVRASMQAVASSEAAVIAVTTCCHFCALCSLGMALSQARLFEDPVPLVHSCPFLDEIRLAEEIKELTIEVKDGGQLQVHRIILAARIPSLRAKLSGPLTEENSVLRWPTIPLSIASKFISYVYTGRVEITHDNVRGMVTLAIMMKMPDLENWAVNFMARRVNLENLSSTWDFAHSMKIGSLMEICTHLMKTEFQSFVRSDIFVCLPADTMLAILQDDNLSVDSEEEVFAAISSWVGPGSEDLNERLKLHAPTMLKEVRWLQTTDEFRIHLMEDHPMFQNSFGCTRFLGQVEQWMRLEDKGKARCPFNQNRRVTVKFQHSSPAEEILVVFGKEKNPCQWSVFAYNSDLQNEERIADMEYCWNATYSVVGNSIFVIGGVLPNGSTRVQEFLVRERRWLDRSSLAVRRCQHAAAVVRVAGADGEKTLIGIFGGFDHGRGELQSCEVYEVGQDRWCKLPDLREKRWTAAAASVPGDSRIFVFGGYNDSFLDSVEFCQLGADWQARASAANSADFWLPAAPMRTARSRLAATHFHGRILVAGGWAGGNLFNVVELFSPPNASCPLGQWTELAGMRHCRKDFTLLTLAGGAVFALGGTFRETPNTVEALTAPYVGTDPTSWVWSLKSPLETLSIIHGAASMHM